MSKIAKDKVKARAKVTVKAEPKPKLLIIVILVLGIILGWVRATDVRLLAADEIPPTFNK